MVTFTWIIFILNPFIGSLFVLIGLYKDRKANLHYSIMMALLFASLAYWFIPLPNHEMDLTRYFSQLSVYSNMAWDTFAEVVLKGKVLIVQELLFYVISKTNNFHLLPVIVIFITYLIIFYMVTDYSNRYKISSKDMFKTIIFIVCILPFPALVSNIRNILAFVIFVFAVYREFEQNKRNVITYILYILPIFIHIASLALLLIRLLTTVYDLRKKSRIIISFVIIGVSFLTGTFANLVQNSALSSNRIISAFFMKADSYVNNTDSAYALYLQSNTFMKLEKIYFIGVVIFFIFILFQIKSYLQKSSSLEMVIPQSSKKLLSFYSMVCLIVIGTAPIVLTVYLRFAFVAIILSFIILLRRENFIKVRVYRQFISMAMLLGAVGGLLHQVALMSQMINIYQMITFPMVRSLFNMFMQ